ncbi:hypothetical protein R3P38DRAFT_2815912 [Favolaschia claudopus]|uniref:Uncharacterized protein n=1 Tax=Favolaschia claudopus TaxID=2862362 RepID=A0AAV9Z071_9AGAR
MSDKDEILTINKDIMVASSSSTAFSSMEARLQTDSIQFEVESIKESYDSGLSRYRQAAGRDSHVSRAAWLHPSRDLSAARLRLARASEEGSRTGEFYVRIRRKR